MIQGLSEIAALCVGFVGLIGAAATTGMPMWKVTAFIGENIIVMETRWEGLWMNCYRQANIRMQCKVYDSLLYLPPDLQAARGLMCCSLALSGLALLLALAGMRCTSCIEENERAKSIVLLVAGGMQVVSSICVFVPVSWTGNVIIRDFYNPLLIDAQRRELGEALYIGWVTGALLFASGLLFCCRRVPSHKESFDIYHPDNMRPALMRFQPVSSVRGSARSQQPLIQNRSFNGNTQASPFVPNVPLMNPQEMYNPGLVNNIPVQYSGGFSHHPPSTQSSSFVGSLSSPGNPLYFSQTTTPYAVDHLGNPSMSYSSGFQAIPQNTVFLGYNHSRAVPHSGSQSSAGVYI